MILILESFTMYLEVQILVIWSNHEFGVLIMAKLSVLKIKAEIVNVCMWGANLLLQ